MNDITAELRQRPGYARASARHQSTNEKHENSAVMGGAASIDLSTCLVTAADLEAMQVPKRTRLLDRWLCAADLGYIFAPRGVGKTWLAMALPSAISQGNSLGQWQAGEQACSVLYVDGEMPLELDRKSVV